VWFDKIGFKQEGSEYGLYLDWKANKEELQSRPICRNTWPSSDDENPSSETPVEEIQKPLKPTHHMPMDIIQEQKTKTIQSTHSSSDSDEFPQSNLWNKLVENKKGKSKKPEMKPKKREKRRNTKNISELDSFSFNNFNIYFTKIHRLEK